MARLILAARLAMSRKRRPTPSKPPVVCMTTPRLRLRRPAIEWQAFSSNLRYSDYRRATPAENVKLGFSRKARHYVPKSVKRVTKRTPSITARAHETLRTRQVHGLASPEQATQARREGGLSYSSQDQAERVAKAADRRLRKKARAKRRRMASLQSSEKGNV